MQGLFDCTQYYEVVSKEVSQSEASTNTITITNTSPPYLINNMDYQCLCTV